MNDDGWLYGETRYSEDTIQKVYDALAFSGYSHPQISNIVNALENSGLLFRERLDD